MEIWRAKTNTRIPIAMRENAKALCDVTGKIIQDRIKWECWSCNGVGIGRTLGTITDHMAVRRG